MKSPATMFSFLPLLAMLTIGCAATPVVLTPNASDVRTGKADPSENAKELGPVTGTNGAGCGLYGYRGTYERAYSQLKNNAAALGANYVQISLDHRIGHLAELRPQNVELSIPRGLATQKLPHHP